MEDNQTTNTTEEGSTPPEQETEQTTPDEPTQEPVENNPPEIKEDEIQNKLTENNFNYDELEQEYLDNNGKLTEATMKKLNGLGFSNEFINDFIKGKEAIREQEIGELAEVIGGRETYNNVINWVSNNLKEDEIQAINQVRDKFILKLILPTLKNNMEVKEGKLPELSLKGVNANIGEEVFNSREEMYAAIRDERYLKDTAYQAKVTKKIRASRNAGIDLGI